MVLIQKTDDFSKFFFTMFLKSKHSLKEIYERQNPKLGLLISKELIREKLLNINSIFIAQTKLLI